VGGDVEGALDRGGAALQRPHPPLIFGGESKPALRRAAELGDGWYGTAYSPEGVREPLRLLKDYAEAAGRDFRQLEITVGLHRGQSPNRETAERFAAAGVHRLMVFAPGFVPRREWERQLLPALETFADQLISKPI
jgi:alkanesulfonate monooxygenase SsuD/methylene tetrahydromethanopterin reductase-like flavin-dependent oxidoreductase (luciferase family)